MENVLSGCWLQRCYYTDGGHWRCGASLRVHWLPIPNTLNIVFLYLPSKPLLFNTEPTFLSQKKDFFSSSKSSLPDHSSPVRWILLFLLPPANLVRSVNCKNCQPSFDGEAPPPPPPPRSPPHPPSHRPSHRPPPRFKVRVVTRQYQKRK